MASPRATPIIVGVGDVINRSRKPEDAIEPMQLMLEAIQLAIRDANLTPSVINELRSSIDSLDVIRTWTWPYPNLPFLLSEKLGIKLRHTYYSSHSGMEVARLVDAAARRISFGETKVAVVTGGEAMASLIACAAVKKMPPPGWTKLDQSCESDLSPAVTELESSLGTVASIHSIGAPIQVYPLFENAFRAYRGQSIEQNNKESAQMYAEFAKLAEQNPLAWNYGKIETEDSIGTITERNRIICFPYPLLMNAFNNVNLAGACLLTSTDYAERLGIDKNQWIYLLGGAGTQDHPEFWRRPNFYTSPAISRSLDTGLAVSGLTKDEIDFFDFYSCFPIVPKLACHYLGLPITKSPKPFSVLGGLTFFGGPGNNYSMHAITEMVRKLRKGDGRHGAILANGGVVTYQQVICLSSQPRKDRSRSPYPDSNPLPEIITDILVPPTEARAEGEAIIETYTVDFNRDGSPLRGHVVGRLKKNGYRFLANHGDETTLQQLSTGIKEPIGRSGWVKPDTETNGRNLFSLDAGANL